MEILENPGRGQKGQEEARKKPEEARKRPQRGQEEARRGQEEAGRGARRPGKGQKRPGEAPKGQDSRIGEKARNPEFGEKLLETQCFMNRK